MVYLLKHKKEVCIINPYKQWLLIINNKGRRTNYNVAKPFKNNKQLTFIQAYFSIPSANILYQAKSWNKVRRHADMLLLMDLI